MIKEVQHYAGDYLEVDFLPFKEYKSPGVRQKKSKPTREAQAYLNQKNRERALYMLVHENFTRNDYIIHPTYSPAFLPPDKTTALRDRRNFILRLKRLYKKYGIKNVKAVFVLEQGEKNGRYHHHIYINGGVPREEIEKCWGLGICDSDRLQFSERGLEGLSKYLVKSGELSENGESSRCTFKTYSHTRNLRKPPAPKERRVSAKVFKNLWDNYECREFFEARYKDYFFVTAEPNNNSDFGEKYLTVKLCKKTAKLDLIYSSDYGGASEFASPSSRARRIAKAPPG